MKKSELTIIVLAAMLFGIVLGQVWAYYQKQNRDSLCRQYGMYCDECVHPFDKVKK